MSSQGPIEVHLLGFGEPSGASPAETLAYLERIFRANARLDGDLSPEEVAARCRALAERRAPGLLADYERIGGSPLLEQCRVQARRLEAELARRERRATVRTGMQFTEPFISELARAALAAGAERIVALPLYPLCGASTTVAALEALHDAFDEALEENGGPDSRAPAIVDLAGWHAHPGFVDAVAAGTAAAARAAGVSFDDSRTRLYFSAHGTPVKYLREGNRYDAYVEEACGMVADRLGVADYDLGYQNHANRGIEWTAPSNEDLLPGVDADVLVVVPISFIHEQSETLVELDEDLRELAEANGKKMIRVPVPFDATSLTHALADLVESALEKTENGNGAATRASEAKASKAKPPGLTLRPCQCRPGENTWCLNADRPRGATP
ncbi:MAG: ferrochelatase [Gemmatimonadales bacterium]